MARLKIIWPDKREQEYEINRTITMIGRTSDNDLKLSDKGISRKQCKIEGSPGNYSLIDLDSKNGTMVNGSRISTSQLKNNDLIVIGRIQITFKEESGEETANKEAPAVPAGGKRTCPSCGEPIKEGDALCVKCGTFIKKDKSLFQGRSVRDSWVSWAVLFGVLLLLAVGAFIFMNGDKNNNTGSAEGGEAVLEIIRAHNTPTRGTYGDLFDSLNISDSELKKGLKLETREHGVYRAVLVFKTGQGMQKMVFNVDTQSRDAEDVLDDDDFTFTEFP